MANLLKFLLLKYHAKELTSKPKILDMTLTDNQDHIPVVFRKATQCLQLVFGMAMKEVDPREHIYILVPTLGLTCDAMPSGGQSLPKAGFLVLVLSLIIQDGDFIPEEVVWETLSRMGVCPRRKHSVFGEPRELLTHVWVWEGYLEYRQVPDSDPVHYEFLWGPRAYAEISKYQVTECLLRVNERFSRVFPPPSAEAVREEEEGP
ncbi:hypothetical protein G4228_019686 [Cervus hanglu yarkandensis]|uniref:MAGE domain-containing protein n=1 Tax=Cervus hanglu yarkandensis TaxID=84702 RepID=A0A833WGD5_9CERV|nr:hypothetical protein G4228_019686 [Cervus hanglu yarkandensis]